MCTAMAVFAKREIKLKNERMKLQENIAINNQESNLTIAVLYYF